MTSCPLHSITFPNTVLDEQYLSIRSSNKLLGD
uniref:Uncharacterized protein n=1 Tax=Rhizophora mucronata TaxID=61149 RepID=A0A2P2NCB8_RHIMU